MSAEKIYPTMSAETIDHKMEFIDTPNSGNSLSRQVTVTMSPDQYERLFFQPKKPTAGDFAKRFANPTLLGLLSFLAPYTSTMFMLQGWGGAVPPTSLVGLTGDYYFFGVGMVMAGIAEFILGNSFPFAVFSIFGVHWMTLAYAQAPTSLLTSVFTKAEGGAAGAAWESSQGFHNVTMCILCAVLLIGTLRINVPFVLTFIGLVFMFAFSAAADFAVPHATTAADLEHVGKLVNIAGHFGMLGVICGWYLAILTVMESVGLPNFLPVFDLSTKVFPTKAKDMEA